MQPATRRALKERLAEWEVTQERFFIAVSRLPRPAQQEAYLAHRSAERREERRRRKRRLKRQQQHQKGGATPAVVGGDGLNVSSGNGLLVATSESDGGGTLVGNTTTDASEGDFSDGGSSASSASSSVHTLTGCTDQDVLDVYPTLTRREQRQLKAEDKVAVAAASTSGPYLAAKVEFLEDMLCVYQHEVEHQIKVNGSATFVKELQADLRAAEDRVSHISVLLRRALDEVTAVQRDKEATVQRLTAEFQRAMQRETERREIALRDFEHEKALLRAKIKAVEATADDAVAAARASTASEGVAMRGRIENYVAQIRALEASVAQEQNLRTKAESDLWDATQRLYANDGVRDAARQCGRRLQEAVAKELRNQRLVFGELSKAFAEGSGGAWRWEGDPNGIVALSIRAQQSGRLYDDSAAVGSGGSSSGNDDTTDGGGDGAEASDGGGSSGNEGIGASSSNSKRRRKRMHAKKSAGKANRSAIRAGRDTFLRSTAAEEGDVNALYNDILRSLFPGEASIGATAADSGGGRLGTAGAGAATDTGAVGRQLSLTGVAGASSSAGTGGSGNDAVAALQQLLRTADTLGVVVAQYQGDLLQCLTTGCAALLRERRALKARLLECYANAELQGRRAEETARARESQKEAAAAERDRALVLRDRLARQLRVEGAGGGGMGAGGGGMGGGGGYERRLTKHAECQTNVVGGGALGFGGSAASNVAATTAAGVTFGGVSTTPPPAAGAGGSAAAGTAGGGAAPHYAANSGAAMPSALKSGTSFAADGGGRRGVTIQDARS